MPEILTESFCERCGTRYTFESAAPRTARLKGLKVMSRGLRNFVMSDDTSMDEAMAAARNESDREQTSHQLEAFHKTFNFCMSCRQYTCGNCWNEADGRCLSCAPLGFDIAPAPFPNLGAGGAVTLTDSEAVGLHERNGHDGPSTFEPMSWPTSDLMREAESPVAEAWPAFEAEPPAEPVEPAVVEPVIAPEPTFQVEPVPEPEPALEFEPMLEPELIQDSEPSFDVEPIDFAARLEAIGGSPDTPRPGEPPVDHRAAAAAANTADLFHRFRPGESLDDEIEAYEREHPAAQPDVALPPIAVDVVAEVPAPVVPPAEPVRPALEPAAFLPPAEAPVAGRVEPTHAPVEPTPAPVEPPVVAAAPEPRPQPIVVEAAPEPAPAVAEPEPEVVVAAAPAPLPEPVIAEPDPAPVIAPREPEPVVAAAAPAPQPEPVIAEPELPQPVTAAPQPEPVAVVAAPEPEPVITAAPLPEPEPEPIAATPEPEPAPVAAAAELQPESEPVPTFPREDLVPQPTWQIVAPEAPPTVGSPVPPVPPASVPADTIAADAQPAWPAQPQWPNPQGAAGLPFLGRPPVATGGIEALWAESAREVTSADVAPGPRAAGGVQPCVSCGLSLSANARFCRRCGTRQA